MTHNYDKVQELLLANFDSERRYYNAAEDSQIVPITRFLNHQSVKRNQYASEIVECLALYDIEPSKSWVNKGNLHRNGLEVKEMLEDHNTIVIIQQCLEKDKAALDIYRQVLDENILPMDILEPLSRHSREIIFSNLEAKEIIEELKTEARKNDTTPIIKMKKRYGNG